MSSFSSYFLTSSTAAVLSAALLLAGPRLAYSAPPVIGGPTFKTIYNSEHTLADVLEPGDRGLVLYFMHDTCPVVQLYVPRLKKLHEEFALQGVRFVGIYANRGDNTFAMARHSLQKDIPFLVLYDKQQLLLDRIGVERTGTAVLLDTAGNVRFHGPVDDQFTKGRAKTAATRHSFAMRSRHSLPASRRPSRSLSPCRVASSLVATIASPRSPATFYKDVLPIFQKHCQVCHRPGQVRTFSLLTYQDAVNWSAMISEVVAERRMPPWRSCLESRADDRRPSK